MRKDNLVKLVLLIIIVAVATYFSIKPIQNKIRLGLDIRGGVNLVLQAYPGPGKTSITKDDMDTARQVVEKRVNASGVSEPNIQVDNVKNRIILDLAGIDNIDDAVSLLATTAQLTFRDPNDETKVILSGTDLKDARASRNSQGQFVVNLSFNDQGAKIFGDTTSANIGKNMAIYLDENQVTNPRIESAITNGQAEITGGYKSLEEAAKVASLLRSGALPVSLKIEERRQVGALLGADSLTKSLNAAKWGILIVLIFMIIWYRVPGLVANFSLIVYGLLVLGVMIALNAVLTLPGLAGFVLSIGMAVDFNIIIYERLKEELRSGKRLRAAIDAAFNRAFITVIDAHVTTGIVAVVLIVNGTSLIQGFATTLLIGILASLVTAVFFTRFVLRIVAGLNSEQNTKLYGG